MKALAIFLLTLAIAGNTCFARIAPDAKRSITYVAQDGTECSVPA